MENPVENSCECKATHLVARGHHGQAENHVSIELGVCSAKERDSLIELSIHVARYTRLRDRRKIPQDRYIRILNCIRSHAGMEAPIVPCK